VVITGQVASWESKASTRVIRFEPIGDLKLFLSIRSPLVPCSEEEQLLPTKPPVWGALSLPWLQQSQITKGFIEIGAMNQYTALLLPFLLLVRPSQSLGDQILFGSKYLMRSEVASDGYYLGCGDNQLCSMGAIKSAEEYDG
jgi:hypothetical protein